MIIVSTLKIKYNEEIRPSFVPQLRKPGWFKEEDIIYYFLTEKNIVRKGRVIEINEDGTQVKLRVNHSYKIVSIYDPRLLRPEDFFFLIYDPIHLRGWLGSFRGDLKEFQEPFEQVIKKKREKIFSSP